jgi:large subunit ribosomal protein L25
MEATLQAEKRDGRGKNEARRLRASGKIPAIVYGTEKNKATEIAVDPKVLLRILHSESGVNTLIGLEGAGLSAGGKVLVKEYQLDPIDHKLLHADFYAVAMDKMLTVTVPVVLKGEPRGVKQQGGVVDFVNREIEVECLPADIPEHIDIDISELMLHQGIRVRDLAQDGKWKPISEPETMIVQVVTVRVEEAPAAEATAAAAAPAGAAAAEPEVIKKGKKDEDEGDKDKKEKK